MKNTTFKNNPSRPRSKKLLYVVISVVILGLLIGSGYYFNEKSASRRAAEQQKARDEAQTESAKKEDLSTKETALDAKNDTQSGEDISSNSVASSDINASITSISQANREVIADAVLSGSTQTGTCLFIFSTPESQPVTRQVASSTTSCSTKIPEAEFAKLGEWKLSLTYVVNNKKTEVSKNVTIN